MMAYFNKVSAMVEEGCSPSEVSLRLEIKRNTAVKLMQLARMKLGITNTPLSADELRDIYEVWGMPVDQIADAYGVSVSTIKDMIRAFGMSRDAGASARAGFRESWNAGRTKNDDERLAHLSEQRAVIFACMARLIEIQS